MNLKNFEEREKWISLYEQYNFILTQNQKQIFHLYFIEDLSLSEISEIMATSRSAIHDSIKKSKEKFNKILETMKI